MVLYAREALLGARGGGLAEQVADIDYSERGLTSMARASRPCAPASAIREFVLHTGSNPMGSLEKGDLMRSWASMADQANHEHSSPSSSPLPALIRSRAGVVHKAITHRITRCGWNWGANADAVAAPVGAVLSCRKCAGKRIKWGAAHRLPVFVTKDFCHLHTKKSICPLLPSIIVPLSPSIILISIVIVGIT